MGVTPIRARRRDVNELHISLPNATIRDKSLEKSEKTDLCITKSKYSNIIILCTMLRVPVKRNIYIRIQEEFYMKFRSNKKITSLILCMMLIVAMAFTTGCGEKKTSDNVTGQEVSKGNVLGEGQTQFTFTVVDKDGKETAFEIHTDKTTVGEALLEVGLIAGEESQYGLYVKTVNGITADYDVDQTYWAFYVNGEYAMTGVDSTNVEADATYSFKVEH